MPDKLETAVEEQLAAGMTANTAANIAAGSHALEHDHNWLYRPQSDPEVNVGPPPLGVSVIDHSLIVFGKIFPRAAHKHRLQMLNHFNECIRHRPFRRNTSPFLVTNSCYNFEN